MPTSTDYTGRQLDVPALVVDAQKIGTGTFQSPLYFDESHVISGTQKSLQSFVSLLFTVRGSTRNATLGCEFLSALAGHQIRTETDLRNYFAKEATDVVAQVNSGSYYADERISAVFLETATVDRQSITMRIKFVMDSGENPTILVPISKE